VGFGAGQMVTAIDVRKYAGDFQDVEEFTRRIWTASYGGKMWFPLWDAGFLRWQFGAGGGDLTSAAYDGANLVGTLLATRQDLRVGRSVYPISMFSWCTVDPEYRNLSVFRQLIRAYRQNLDDQKLAFSLGIVSGDTTSIAYRFWHQYAKAYPQDFRFFFRFGTWVKVLTPAAAARGSVKWSERMIVRAIAPLLKFTPLRSGASVRHYVPADLPACTLLLQETSKGFDWALAWTQERLASQLQDAAARTLVFDRGKGVQGLVNYHCLTMEGLHPIRAGLIDIWADDGLTLGERVRLLGAACDDLRNQGAHIVFAMRSAMMPAPAFAANLFLPFPSKDHLIVLFPRGLELPSPKTWSLLLR
jgi:hypothetical protein